MTSFTANDSALSGVVPPRGACLSQVEKQGNANKPSEVTTSVSYNGSALWGVVPPRNACPSQDEQTLNVDKPTSLPRCVDSRRAADLPSRGLAHTPSLCGFSGASSQVATSVSTNGSALPGVVSPRYNRPSLDERKLNVDKPTPLPRCVGPLRAADLPSTDLANTPSLCGFSGASSQVTTSVSTDGCALSGVVSPRSGCPSLDERKLKVDKPTSLSRDVGPRHAADLPSRGLAHSPSLCGFSGASSQVATSVTSKGSRTAGCGVPEE